MTLALLPLGLISVYQTNAVVEEAQRLKNSALMARTLSAATAERELIQNAVGAAQGLAITVAQSWDDPDFVGECRAIMRNFVEATDPFIFAGYIEASGLMRCASQGEEVDFSGAPGLAPALASAGPTIAMNTAGEVTGQSVVLVSHRVQSEGVTRGLITLSIPHWVANTILERAEFDDGLVLASVNADGVIVSSSTSLDGAAEYLPRDFEEHRLLDRGGDIFRAASGNGEERYFAVTTVISDELVLVGSWPTTAGLSDVAGSRIFVMVFPILMWFAGIGVAYFGLQRLVVRHIQTLRSSMRRFALGDRGGAMVALEDAPEELLEAERAFNRMAVIITDAENRQAQDLKDKEILLREVHHRVKNNLQLIASIMNMQARNAKAPETQRMIGALQRRVRGLATLHRTFYTTPDMTTINAEELVRVVVKDTAAIAADRDIDVRTELEPFQLLPDQAMPLSMLLSEALTNAFKYIGKTADGLSLIKIILTGTDEDKITLAIENTLPPGGAVAREGTSGDGLGTPLMSAFVRQLEGVEAVEQSTDRYRTQVTFPKRAALDAT